MTAFDVAVLWENATLTSHTASNAMAQPDHQLSRRLTSLHLAARFNNMSCAELSLSVYPDLSVEDHAGARRFIPQLCTVLKRFFESIWKLSPRLVAWPPSSTALISQDGRRRTWL